MKAAGRVSNGNHQILQIETFLEILRRLFLWPPVLQRLYIWYTFSKHRFVIFSSACRVFFWCRASLLSWKKVQLKKKSLYLATTFEIFAWQGSTESPTVQAAMAPGMLVDWLMHLYGPDWSTFFGCLSMILFLWLHDPWQKNKNFRN